MRTVVQDKIKEAFSRKSPDGNPTTFLDINGVIAFCRMIQTPDIITDFAFMKTTYWDENGGLIDAYTARNRFYEVNVRYE